MAQLGRLEFTITDTSGNAVSGATVEVRRQGAQVNGAQSGTPITVDAINGVLVGDVVVRNSLSSGVAVTAITATTISLGSGGFANVSDDDRLSIASTLPTIYEDAEANTSTPNPLTTNASGFAGCYIVGGKYDVLITASGTATLRQDVVAYGGESNRSNVYMGGADVAWIFDTLRTTSAGDKLISIRTNGSERFGVTAAVATVTGNLTVTGQGSVGNTLSTTGIANIGTITSTSAISTSGASGNITAALGDIIATAGTIKATAGDVSARRALFGRGTQLLTTDFSLSAGWGDTATKSVQGAAYDTCGEFRVTANGAGIAANPNVVLMFKNGAYPGVNAPNVIVTRSDAAAPTTGFWTISSRGTGSFTAAFIGLPVAGNQYQFQWFTVGGDPI